MELVISGAAQVEDERLLLKPGAAQVETEQLKTAIEKMQKTGKPKKLEHWVYMFGARSNRLTKSILLSLLDKGILREDGKVYRWGTVRNAEAQGICITKYLLKRQLRDAVFCQQKVDEHETALLSLMEACGLLDHLFTTDEMIAARKMIRGLLKEEKLSQSFCVLLTATTEAVAFAVAAAVSV